MTTIVVDVLNKKVVSDSKVTWGSPAYFTRKIFVAKDGTLVTFCGCLDSGVMFCDWVQAGMSRKWHPTYPAESSFTAITVNDKGVFAWGENMIPSEVVDSPYFAMGSGSHYAMAALHCGKTPEEAVELAIKLDEYSGGAVRSVSYVPVKRKSTKGIAKAKPRK